MLDSLHADPLPFRAAVESGDQDAIMAALADDVRLFPPMVDAPYEGREIVAGLMRRVLFEVFEDFRYIGELREGSDEVLRFRAHIGDCDIEGVDLIHSDADGRVAEVRVIIRPLAGLHALHNAFGAQLPRMDADR
jgi:hypothetical protein